MKFFIFLGILGVNIAFSALAPIYQTSREINAILNDPKIVKVGDDQIKQIIKTEKGWLLITKKNVVDIFVRYKPNKMLGPKEFDLEFRMLE